MTDHLPECYVPDFHNERWICICPLLRACEQRVREDERKKAHNVIDSFDMYIGDRDAMHAWIDGTPPDWWTETSNG